jgi:uncharacterized protein (TIGR03435 family)
MLGIAFRLRGMGFIKGAEDWVIAGSERFSVDAKAEDPTTTTEQQLLVMLQNLLIERFQLKYHEESKDMPGFALIVAKNGPKLKESTSDDAGVSFGPSLKPMPGEPIDMTARKFSMAALTNLLSQIGPGPVVDRTQLSGLYDFKLAWDDTRGPSLFTALQEQLGLRLEAQKIPVAFFVIDSAQRPSRN